jgi:HlyD family secretion protein
MGVKMKRVAWAIAAIAIAAGVVRASAPKPVAVSTAEVTRGALAVALRVEGRTRLRARYAVAAPVGGKLERITLEPGDEVAAGAPLARIVPRDPAPLDARARAEAAARQRGTAAARARAAVAIEEARAAHDFARTELARMEQLAQGGSVPPHDVEKARQEERIRGQALESTRLAAQVAAFELEQASAALGRAGSADARDAVTVSSPIGGRVLRVTQRDGIVAAGAPLLDVADPALVEVVVDALTTDAARIPPGARVKLEGWGGEAALGGRVRLVEPSAFTKVSALGVEEQRVPVIIDLDEPARAAGGLGDGYRIEARIALWEGDAVVRVPLAALFREGDRWAVFTVAGGKAARRLITLGHRGVEEAEVLDGLAPGDRVIAYPGDQVADGAAVKAR